MPKIQNILDSLLRRNERLLRVPLQVWMNFAQQQIRRDLTERYQKSAASKLTDWQLIQNQGVTTIKPAVLEIMKAAGQTAYTVLAVQGAFDVLNVPAVKAVNKFCSTLVTEVTKNTKKGINVFIKQGIKDGKSMPKIARELKPLVGLTSKQTQGVINYRKILEVKRPDFTVAQIDRAVTRYTNKVHRMRMENIARTETARAQNIGYCKGLEEVGVGEVELSNAFDACEICEELNGKRYKVGEGADVIPVHPRCRCAMLPVIDDKMISEMLKKPPAEIKIPAEEIKPVPKPMPKVPKPTGEGIPTKASGKPMTQIDERLIGRYTSFDYEGIVKAQLGKPVPSYTGYTKAEALKIAKKTEQSLLKLPGWEGKSFRGMKFSSANEQATFLKNIKLGGDYKFDAFQSATSDLKVAKSFMSRQASNQSALLHIDGQTGRDVLKFSRNKNEKEILFLKNSKFVVSKVEGNNIYLKEIIGG